MGLFDKIKDNAKNISIRALEDEENYNQSGYSAGSTVEPDLSVADVEAAEQETPQELVSEIAAEVSDESEKAKSEKTTKTVDQPADNNDSEKAEDSVPVTKAEEKKPAKSEETKKPKTESKSKVSVKTEKKPVKTETPRLNGKPYTPSYKQPATDTGKSGSKAPRVIDITPKQRPIDEDKRVILERERAIMATLASQRRLDGTTPLYVTSHLKFKTRVFINRIEYSGSFGKNVIPIEQVAWVKLRSSGTGVIIETPSGKRVVMVVKPADRLAFAEAVLKVQSMQPKKTKFQDTRTVRIDQLEQMEESIDELEKLARLLDKGIVTQEEFDAKKKQILGI